MGWQRSLFSNRLELDLAVDLFFFAFPGIGIVFFIPCLFYDIFYRKLVLFAKLSKQVFSRSIAFQGCSSCLWNIISLSCFGIISVLTRIFIFLKHYTSIILHLSDHIKRLIIRELWEYNLFIFKIKWRNSIFTWVLIENTLTPYDIYFSRLQEYANNAFQEFIFFG